MTSFGVSASDVALVLCQGFVGLALSVPFAALVAVARGGASGAARLRGHARRRSRRPAETRHVEREKEGRGGRGGGGERRSAPRPGPDAPYAVHLRRAVRVVRLFATAPPGGEREAAYHALVRIAAAARGPSPAGGPLTPGALYRDLTRGAPWRVTGADAPAFDARTCAELDRRDAAREHSGYVRGKRDHDGAGAGR